MSMRMSAVAHEAHRHRAGIEEGERCEADRRREVCVCVCVCACVWVAGKIEMNEWIARAQGGLARVRTMDGWASRRLGR